MASRVLALFSRAINDLKGLSLKQWAKLLIGIVGLLGITVGLSYAAKLLLARIHLPVFDVAWITYLAILVAFALTNLVPSG